MFQIDPKGEVLARTHDMDLRDIDTKSNDNIPRGAVRNYIKTIKVGSSQSKKKERKKLKEVRRAKER